MNPNDELYDPDAVLYDCPGCMDVGYLPAAPKRIPSHTGKGFVIGPAVWFCDCQRGKTMSAGYWFRACYPEDDKGRRHPSPVGEIRLRDYLDSNPLDRRWLPDAVKECSRRYDAERKRTLEGQESR
jgi:hypothetical protein